MASKDLTIKLNAEGNAPEKLNKLDMSLGKLVTGMAALDIAGAAIGAIGDAAGKALNIFSDFDSAMTQIAARQGLAAEELEQLEKQVLSWAQTTSFSAQEAVEGIQEVTSSGSSLEEAIALMPAIMDFASASMLDLGGAADIVTDTIAQFGLGVGDAVHITDKLVQASQSSSATVPDLADALKNVGSVASSFGLTVDQTTQALALLAEAGVKGAEAGTGLKSMLQAMQRAGDDVWETLSKAAGIEITMFNDDGSLKDFAFLMNQIQDAMSRMDDQQSLDIGSKLFGSYGITSATAILNATGGLDQMGESMNAQASATEVAQKQLESFENQVGLLQSSLETLAIEVMQPLVEDVLKPIIPIVMEMVNAFTTWLDETDAIAKAMEVVKAIFEAVVGFLQSDTFGAWISAFEHAVNVVVSLLQGDLEGAFNHFMGYVSKLGEFWFGIWQMMRTTVLKVVLGIVNVVEAMVNAIIGIINGLIGGVLEGLAEMARALPLGIGNDIAAKLESAARRGVIGRVDLTSGIEREITRLQIEGSQKAQVFNINMPNYVGSEDEVVGVIRRAQLAGRIG